MKRQWLITLCMFFVLATCNAAYAEDAIGSVAGKVNGYVPQEAPALAILYDQTNAYQGKIAEDGTFFISDVAAGSYYVKLEVEGYPLIWESSNAKSFGLMIDILYGIFLSDITANKNPQDENLLYQNRCSYVNEKWGKFRNASKNLPRSVS